MYLVITFLFVVCAVISMITEAPDVLYILSLIIAALCIYQCSRIGKIGLFSIVTLTMIGLVAYCLAVPTNNFFTGQYNGQYYAAALLACCLAMFSQLLGCYFGYYRKPNKRSSLLSLRGQVSYYEAWIVVVVGLVSSFLALYWTVGVSAYLDAGYAGRSLLKREAGPVELGLYHTIFGFVVIYSMSFFDKNTKRAKKYRKAVLIAAVAFIAYSSFLGIRRPSFFVAMSIFSIFVISRDRTPIAAVMSAGIAVFFLAIFANFRQVLSDGGVASAASFVGSNVNWAWLDLSATELGAPFRALLDVLSLWDSEAYRFGSSYLHSIPNVLPSAIFDPGPSLSEEYTARVFSQLYIDIGGNMGFFPVAEGMVNAGYIGVLINFFLVGALIGLVQRHVEEHATVVNCTIYGLAFPWYIFYIRTDLSSFTKVLFYSIVVPLILFFLLRFVSKVALKTGGKRA